MPLDKVYKKLR